jgi:hypothetical protein
MGHTYWTYKRKTHVNQGMTHLKAESSMHPHGCGCRLTASHTGDAINSVGILWSEFCGWLKDEIKPSAFGLTGEIISFIFA